MAKSFVAKENVGIFCKLLCDQVANAQPNIPLGLRELNIVHLEEIGAPYMSVIELLIWLDNCNFAETYLTGVFFSWKGRGSTAPLPILECISRPSNQQPHGDGKIRNANCNCKDHARGQRFDRI